MRWYLRFKLSFRDLVEMMASKTLVFQRFLGPSAKRRHALGLFQDFLLDRPDIARLGMAM